VRLPASPGECQLHVDLNGTLEPLCPVAFGSVSPDRIGRPSGSDEAGLVGQDHGLDSVAALELHQDASDMGFHSRLPEEELLRYLVVRLSASHMDEDFGLANGQIW
jgi:hypothetical protein